VGRLAELTEGLKQQLDRIEAQLAELLRQRTVKDYYSTEEAAALLPALVIRAPRDALFAEARPSMSAS
jgi:hypothetical protein